MEKVHILLLSLVVGGGIGLFPLLTGSVGAPATQVVEAAVSDDGESSFPSEFLIDVKGKQIEWDGNKVASEVMTVNGSTYIPVRVLEELGGEVNWDSISGQVKVKME